MFVAAGGGAIAAAAAAAALPYLKLHVCVQYSNQILHMTFKSKAWSVLNLFNLELGNYLSTLFIELKGRIKSHRYPATHFKKIISVEVYCVVKQDLNFTVHYLSHLALTQWE